MLNSTERKIPNGWKILLTYEEIHKSVKKCASFIDQKFGDKELVIVCILKGAVPFLVDLTREMKIDHTWYFIESSSYHDAQK